MDYELGCRYFDAESTSRKQSFHFYDMTNVVRFKLAEKFLASCLMGATGTYAADFEDRGSHGDAADDVLSTLPDHRARK